MGKELAPELSQELQINYEHSKIVQNGVNVVLVAFEPFVFNERSTGTTNRAACWEAIKLLPARGVSFKSPVNVHCYQMRNIYDFIAKQISRCWEKHDPDLLVVVGRHSKYAFNDLVLEEIANGSYYDVLLDQQSRLVRDSCCTRNGPRVLKTNLDLMTVTEKLCAANTGLIGKTIQTPTGYYLCDYAYYNSLFYDMDRSACVRVPEGDEISTEDLTDGLAFCISEMLQQLDNKGLLKVQQSGVTTVVEG